MGRHREIPVSALPEYRRLFMRFYNALLKDHTGVGLYNHPDRLARNRALRKKNPELARARDRQNHCRHAAQRKRYSRQYNNRPEVKQRKAAAAREQTKKARQAVEQWYAQLPEAVRFFAMAVVANRKAEQSERAKKAATEYNRRWLQKNPDKARAKYVAKRHRRRGAPGRFTAREWLECKARYGSKCLACGLNEKQLAGMGRVLAADHVLALATGGSNTIDNIQPLCHGVGGCNNLKGIQYADYRLCNTAAQVLVPLSATAASAIPPMKWRSV